MRVEAGRPEPGTVGRASLFAALFVGAAVNGLYAGMASAIGFAGFWVAAANLFSVSAFIWIALVAILQFAGDGPSEPLRRGDRWVLALLALSCFMPTGWEARIALLGASVYLWRYSAAGSAERRIAIVAASLSMPLVWGRLALHFLAPELLDVDAALVGLLSGHDVQGNTVAFAPSILADEGRRMVVTIGCSSFINLSLSVVVVALVSQMFSIPLGWRLSLFAAAMVVATLGVNVLRLVALASFPDYFDWLHTGVGAQLFGLLSLLAIGMIGLVAAGNQWVRAGG